MLKVEVAKLLSRVLFTCTFAGLESKTKCK